MEKKNLIIFFGEFRTFDLIIHQLKDLDKVDVIVSTWNVDYDGKVSESKIESIYNQIPNVKFLIEPKPRLSVTSCIYYHWKKAINLITDINLYDTIILHRTDMVSDWHVILNENFNKDILYFDYWGEHEINKLFINDHYIIGKFSIIKNFIDLISPEDGAYPHWPLGNLLIKNNIKYESKLLNTLLVKNNMKDFIKELNNMNVRLIECKKNSEHIKKYLEIKNNLS